MKLLLFVMTVLMAGCTAAPDWEANDWDWSTQTGTFTLNQAKIEFGTPFHTKTSSDGGTVVVWRRLAGWTYDSSRLIDKAGTKIGGTATVKARATRYEHAILQFDKDGKLVSGSGFGSRKKKAKMARQVQTRHSDSGR